MKIAFIIWSIVAIIFFIMGLIDRKSEKPTGFWANAKVPEIENIPEYNNAVAKDLVCICSGIGITWSAITIY